jgi:hypothetical protein
MVEKVLHANLAVAQQHLTHLAKFWGCEPAPVFFETPLVWATVI